MAFKFVSPLVEEQAHKLEDIQDDLSLELTLVGEQQKNHVDRHRYDTSNFEFCGLVCLVC